MTTNTHSFRINDKVDLYEGTTIIARGEIFQIQEDDRCHGVLLGRDHVSILIKEAILRDHHLPISHIGADTVGECLNTFALWPKLLVRYSLKSIEEVLPIFEEERKNGDDTQMDLDAESDMDVLSNMEEDSINQINPLDMSLRKNWFKKEVCLFGDFNDKDPIAKGIITLTDPESALDNEKLGENHIGIMIFELCCDYDSQQRKKWLPNYVMYSSSLVRWPIHTIELKNTGDRLNTLLKIATPFILDEKDDTIHEEMDDIMDEDINFDVRHEINVESLEKKRKRAYHFNKRKPLDENAKKEQMALKKSAAHITDEAIAQALAHKCCLRECCRYANRERIVEERKDYYGMSLADRRSYILDQLRNLPTEIFDAGDMVFDTKIICREAYWKIYGFSKSSFYNYMTDFQKGIKRGYHGNTLSKKPRDATMQARAILSSILNILGEAMPHRIYEGEHGNSSTIFVLPSCYSKMDIFEELLSKMEIHDISISKDAFYKLWRNNFENFKFHKTSAFAKCEECTRLKEMLMREKRVKERLELEKRRELHMNEQMSRRNVYYANRILAQERPEEYLCLIHDKMDQAKTYIPKMANQIKKLQMASVNPLPVALTGMLTHGREPGCYAHLSVNGIWPGDPDFTVTSLAKCLRDLEDFNGDHSGDLRSDSTSTKEDPFFSSLLQSDAFIATNLAMKKQNIERFIGGSEETGHIQLHGPKKFKALPRHLRLQLDNSAKDNKNQTMMAFCSELVSRGVFETIEMSFLKVGHTHEDIDAFFSKVSKQIKHIDINSLPSLMAEIWECEKIHPISRVMTEVAAYKDYIAKYVSKIIGQSAPISFRFAMVENKPVFFVKESLNHPWTPPNGASIWKLDETNKPILPKGNPFLKPMGMEQKKAAEIQAYIQEYMQFLQSTVTDDKSPAWDGMQKVLAYWNEISKNLPIQDQRTSALTNDSILQFWPQTNHGTGYKQGEEMTTDTIIHDSLQEELREELRDRDMIYVGPLSKLPKRRFNPLEDIQEGHFVVIRPTDDWEKNVCKTPAIWIGRAKGSILVDVTNENHNCFPVEWWRPKHRNINASEEQRYKNLLQGFKEWEVEPGYQDKQEWVNGNAAIYFWKVRASRLPKRVMISDGVKAIIQEHFNQISN